MRYWTCLAALIFLAGTGFAQTGPAAGARLKVVVVENELSGPPVGNISLSVDGEDANSPASDPVSGSITFIFPDKSVGDSVVIRVKARGYVVVNNAQFPIYLPKDPDKNPVPIIICKSAVQEEMRSRFYLRISIQEIKASYVQRMKDLEDRHLADAETIARLSKERDQVIALATKTAAEFANQDIEMASDLYRKAMQLFLSGKVEDAIQLLDEEKINSQLEAANEQESAARATKEQVKQEWLLKGRLLTLRFQFSEAERAYKAAIDAFPDSFEANFAYAHFSQDLNHFREAEQGYKRCLDLARKDPDKYQPEMANTLNNLGLLEHDQNRMDDARRHYEEALRIDRELAKKKPETYVQNIQLLNNLANLDHDENRRDEARALYEESLNIGRKLAQKQPDYLPEVATTLNNLGNLDFEQGRWEEAYDHLEEAVKIFRELGHKNSEEYLPAMARALSDLGNFDRQHGWLEEAGHRLEEALEILKEVARKNPDTYLPSVAQTLWDLGLLYSDERRMDEARQYFESALETRRVLAQKHPDTYLKVVAITLNDLGNLDDDRHWFKEARSEYDDALKIRRELALKNPDVYLSDVAMTLYNLGILDCDEKQLDQAREHYDEALKIYRKLAEKAPDMYLFRVAKTQAALRYLDRDQQRMKDAPNYYGDAPPLCGSSTSLNNLVALEDEHSQVEDALQDPFAHNGDSICLSEVLISTQQSDDPAQVSDAQHKADSAREAIRQGARFKDIAKKYSDGPTADDGGKLGIFKRGQLAKSIEDTVFAMKLGDVSDVIRTKQGFIILQVTCK